MSIAEYLEYLLINTALLGCYEQLKGGRQRHECHCEDYGEHARHRYLDGKVGILTAVLLSADNSLCVSYRDTSFGSVHEYYKAYHEDVADVEQGNEYLVLGIVETHHAEVSYHIIRHTRDDTREEEHGNTVSESFFAYLISEPYRKERTGCEADDYNDLREHLFKAGLGVGESLCLVFQCQIVSPRLEHADAECRVAGDLVYLLPSLHTFLRELLERRQGVGQELDNDLRVDIR